MNEDLKGRGREGAVQTAGVEGRGGVCSRQRAQQVQRPCG